MPTQREIDAAEQRAKELGEELQRAEKTVAEQEIAAELQAKLDEQERELLREARDYSDEKYDAIFANVSDKERDARQGAAEIPDGDAYARSQERFDRDWDRLGKPKTDGHPIPTSALTGQSGWRKNIKSPGLIEAMRQEESK